MTLGFEKMNVDSDYTFYQSFAGSIMDPEDLVLADELREMITNKEGDAWLVYLEGQPGPVAWCSVSFCTIAELPFSVHILGIAVAKCHANKGLGKKIVEWLITAYPERKLTAAIQPDNQPSQRLFKSFGFQNYGRKDDSPWEIWIK